MLAVLLLLTINKAQGQTIQTTRLPLTITVQPTDLLSLTKNSNPSYSNLYIVRLDTQGFAVEYASAETRSNISIPCTASTTNLQTLKYTWLKFEATSKQWSVLNISEHYKWIGGVNSDKINAGMLTITPYNKTADAGAYMCRAITDHGVAVSKILNLTAASFPNEGVQASVTTRTVPAGSYTRLDVPQMTTTPATNASWTSSTSKDIPYGSGNEIQPNRTQMDETGAIHIGYVDTSLLQIVDVTGTSNYNFYHFKYMSLRYVITGLAIYQLSVTGNVPHTVSCNLQYQTPSLSLVHGQSSRIVCVYAGSPSIRVSYFKQDSSGKPQQLTTQVVAGGDAGQAILQTGLYGNTYMIGSAQTTDAGTYSCSATFKTPTGEKPCNGTTVPINVTVDLEPTFVSEPSPVTYVVEGHSVTLQWRIIGRPVPTIKFYENAVTPLPDNPNYQFSRRDIIENHYLDGLHVYLWTFTLFKAIKPNDSRSLQLFATNPYHIAVSNIVLMVISPITFPKKMGDQLELEPNSTGTFVCTALADDAILATITWTRHHGNVTYPVEDTKANGQYRIVKTDLASRGGLRAFSQTLTVNTSLGGSLDDSRGYYSCKVSNGVTWNVTSARLSFVGDDPDAPAWFKLWMLLAIFGAFAAVIFVTGVVVAVLRNRGETYEVEKEEIKRGFNPKKEAQELCKLHEYYRENESDLDAPLY